MQKIFSESRQNPKLTVVFDFDGTIAETLLAGVDILNSYSADFGFRKVEQEEIENLREKTFAEIIQLFGVSLVKVPFIINKVKKELLRSMDKIKIVPEMKKAMDEIKEAGFGVGLLSSNSDENLRKFCAQNKLTFDFIYSGGSIFGKDQVMKKMLKKEKLDTENIWYVGDEVRDIEAARKTGVRIVSVSWGFNSRRVLEKAQPDFLVDSPGEIMPSIRKAEGNFSQTH